MTMTMTTGNVEDAVLFHDAQDIQNWTSQSVGTTAMEDRWFCSLLVVCIGIVRKVWSMLLEDGLRPKKSKPKHVHLTLYF